ncbi:transcriptional regulator GutM [Eubacteriaceae bacterium ES3]|nr:transcriptional regulator GutM [Eubacteriaceae bacterium ES3]
MVYLMLLFISILIILAYLSKRQVENYHQALKELYNKEVVLGIGHQNGIPFPGNATIIILAVDKKSNRIVGCRRLAGIKIWQPFEKLTIYDSYSLDELRELAIYEDFLLNRRAEKLKVNYTKLADLFYRKGALLQAVEALEQRIQKQKIMAINEKRLKKIEDSKRLSFHSLLNEMEKEVEGA